MSSNICYYISDWLKNAKQKILCHVNKVTTGVYVTPPPFRFQRKHNIYANLLKKNTLFLLSHIFYYTSEKWINTKKISCQIFKVSIGIYVINPNQHPTVIFSQMKKIYVKIDFGSKTMLLHAGIRKRDLHR